MRSHLFYVKYYMLSLLPATMIVIEISVVYCYLYFSAHSTSRSDQVVKREICSIITKGKFLVFCITQTRLALQLSQIHANNIPSHSSHPSHHCQPNQPSHPTYLTHPSHSS